MTTLQMAYAGQRLTSKDTLAQAWVPLEGDDRTLRLYKGGLVKHAGIGTVYEFTLDESGSVFTAGEHAPKRVLATDRQAEWVDRDTRLMWEAADRDARAAHEGVQIRKREKDVSLLREQLLPIRVAMARKPHQAARSAVVNAINEELWRPLTQAEKKEAGLA